MALSCAGSRRIVNRSISSSRTNSLGNTERPNSSQWRCVFEDGGDHRQPGKQPRPLAIGNAIWLYRDRTFRGGLRLRETRSIAVVQSELLEKLNWHPKVLVEGQQRCGPPPDRRGRGATSCFGVFSEMAGGDTTVGSRPVGGALAPALS